VTESFELNYRTSILIYSAISTENRDWQQRSVVKNFVFRPN